MSESREAYTTADVSEEAMGRSVLRWMGYHTILVDYKDGEKPLWNLYCGKTPITFFGMEYEQVAWTAAPNLTTEAGAAGLLTFLLRKGVWFHMATRDEEGERTGEGDCFCSLLTSRPDVKQIEGEGKDWPTALLRAAYALCPGEFKNTPSNDEN